MNIEDGEETTMGHGFKCSRMEYALRSACFGLGRVHDHRETDMISCSQHDCRNSARNVLPVMVH